MGAFSGKKITPGKKAFRQEKEKARPLGELPMKSGERLRSSQVPLSVDFVAVRAFWRENGGSVPVGTPS